ncbi:cytochrome P450 [Pleurotus eryngii]|uniref:Cytochrome P450 n=1 Tax=Pleurotus eryngii TaxID=5323 RepID=A0A9P6D6C5_PLEER|nr:cytochrome P450 [Pleurotus eryngii]
MRRASGQLLNNDSMQCLSEYQRAEATQLMWDICQDRSNLFEHIRRYMTSFMLGVLYGSRGPSLSSPDVADFMDVHPKFMAILEIDTAPPVDIFPVLKLEQLFDRLLSKVENRLESGQQNGALLEEAILHEREWGLISRDHLLHLGGTLLEGSDTCSAALQNAVYTLTIFPEIQRKLHAELNDVVGRDRVPEWDNLLNLPYLKAFIEECNRYRPVGPLGLPHAMSKDEVIDSYLYPKDAVIFTNIYGMFHDERYFDHPEEFIPERFLERPFGIKKGVDDDPARRLNMLFGAGRRVCPGIVLAKATLEINIANFAWGFEFLPLVDAISGKGVYPSLDTYAPGITATPQAFPVRIIPRSEEHIRTIQAQFESLQIALSRMYNSQPNLLDHQQLRNVQFTTTNILIEAFAAGNLFTLNDETLQRRAENHLGWVSNSLDSAQARVVIAQTRCLVLVTSCPLSLAAADIHPLPVKTHIDKAAASTTIRFAVLGVALEPIRQYLQT